MLCEAQRREAEAAARRGVAAAVAAVPPRADGTRGVECCKCTLVGPLPVAKTWFRNHASKEVEEHHDLRTKKARQDVVWSAATSCCSVTLPPHGDTLGG